MDKSITPVSRPDPFNQTIPDQIFGRLPAWVDARPLTVLGRILALALLLNLGILWVSPIDDNLGRTDRFWPVVQNVVVGRGLLSCEASYFPFCGPGNEISASLEPLPVLAFAALAALTGPIMWPAALLEIVLNLGILAGVFLLSRQVMNVRVALLAALLWAVYLPGLKMVPQISGDLFATCFLTWALFFFVRAGRSGRWGDWAWTGLLLGLGILSRSATVFVAAGLIFSLLLAGWLAQRWAGVRRNLQVGFLLGLIITACLLPWMTRNYLVLGKPIAGSSLFGYVLFRQNQQLGSEDYFRIIGHVEAQNAVEALVARHPELSRASNEVEMDKFYTAEALKIIKAYPERYVLLSFYRFLPLWFDWGVNQAYSRQDSLLDYAIMALQAVLLLSALAGIFLKGRETWLLWMVIIIYSLAYQGVNAQIRYIIPVMPVVMLFSALGLTGLLQRFALFFRR